MKSRLAVGRTHFDHDDLVKTGPREECAQLKRKEAEIDNLQARVDAAKDDIRKDLLREFSELRMKRETVRSKMVQLQESGDEIWDDVKDGLEKSWQDLRETFSTVYSRLG